MTALEGKVEAVRTALTASVKLMMHELAALIEAATEAGSECSSTGTEVGAGVTVIKVRSRVLQYSTANDGEECVAGPAHTQCLRAVFEPPAERALGKCSQQAGVLGCNQQQFNPSACQVMHAVAVSDC